MFRFMLLALVAIPIPSSSGEVATPEVVVLSTLHGLHEDVPGYDYDALGRALRSLRPDVLAVELTPTALASRAPQRTKREYPHVVYPFLDALDARAVALEPAEPLYSELVALNVEASRKFAESEPQKAEAFAVFVDEAMAMLRVHWRTPAAANDATTDRVFSLKHRFQDALYPPAQAEAWRRWNEHFLARIVDAARDCRGCRVVALVGAEHGYWLREALADRDDLRLADTAELLRALQSR
jgi:hypothetical protein